MNSADLKRHLADLRLSVTLAGHVRVPLDWRHRQHVTVNNCVYLFLEGEGTLEIGDHAYRPQPGEAYILPAGARISYSTSPLRPFRQMYCHFHAHVGQLPLFRLVDTPLRIRLDAPGQAEALFARLIEAFNSSDEWAPLTVKASMYELLRLLWDAPGIKPRLAQPHTQQRLNDIANYMEAHASGPVTVEEIASAFGYSPKYFFRYFKSAFGTTPHQYLIRLRMDRAKQLLLATDWTIGRIAGELGMERAHFTRMFLQYSEMTPPKFRIWARGEV